MALSVAASRATPLAAPAGLPAFSGLATTKNITRVSAKTGSQRLALPKVASRCRVRCAAGDVSAEGLNYLIAGAIAIGVVGSAFPLLFSRKDLCPVCDGSGFVRSGTRLAGNAGRKDDARIVCRNCNGLGKINQVDK